MPFSAHGRPFLSLPGSLPRDSLQRTTGQKGRQLTHASCHLCMTAARRQGALTETVQKPTLCCEAATREEERAEEDGGHVLLGSST